MEIDDTFARLENDGTFLPRFEELIGNYITVRIPWRQHNPVLVAQDGVIEREWKAISPPIPFCD